MWDRKTKSHCINGENLETVSHWTWDSNQRLRWHSEVIQCRMEAALDSKGNFESWKWEITYWNFQVSRNCKVELVRVRTNQMRICNSSTRESWTLTFDVKTLIGKFWTNQNSV